LTAVAQRSARRTRFQAQAQGLKAVDVRRGVVDGRVVRHGIRAAVRHRDKRMASRVGDARTQAAQQIARRAVLQRRRRFLRQIAAQAAQLADRDEVHGCMRRRGEQERRGDRRQGKKS